MENRIVRALAFGLVAMAVGSSLGVAGLGSAVNGAVVFGPLGFLIGWLVPRSKAKLPSVPSVDTPIVVGMADSVGVSAKSATASESLQEVERSIDQLLPMIGRLLASIWNVQMRGLIVVGLMPTVQRYPWVFAVVGFVSLAIVLPIGIVFVATGFAAMHLNASAKNQFLVDLRSET